MTTNATIEFLQYILDNDPNIDMFDALIKNAVKKTTGILPTQVLSVVEMLKKHSQNNLDIQSQQTFNNLFCAWVDSELCTQEYFDILTGSYQTGLSELPVQLIFANPTFFKKINCTTFLKPYTLSIEPTNDTHILWNLIQLVQHTDTPEYDLSPVLNHIYSSPTFQEILDKEVPHRETFLWSVARETIRAEQFFNAFKHKISNSWFCDFFEYLCTKNPELVPVVLQDNNVQTWIENNLSLYPIIHSSLEINDNNAEVIKALLPEKYHFLLKQVHFYHAMCKRDILRCCQLWDSVDPLEQTSLYYDVAQRILDFPDINFMSKPIFEHVSQEFFKHLSHQNLLAIYKDPLHTKYIEFFEPFALQKQLLTEHISDYIETTEICRKRKI